MEALKIELEGSLDTTAAVQELRTKREQDVVQLKRSLDDEVKAREAQMTDLRHRHGQQVEEVNEQLDQIKRVRPIGFLLTGITHIFFFSSENFDFFYTRMITFFFLPSYFYLSRNVCTGCVCITFTLCTVFDVHTYGLLSEIN